jgi:hypothetical protein
MSCIYPFSTVSKLRKGHVGRGSGVVGRGSWLGAQAKQLRIDVKSRQLFNITRCSFITSQKLGESDLSLHNETKWG